MRSNNHFFFTVQKKNYIFFNSTFNQFFDMISTKKLIYYKTQFIYLYITQPYNTGQLI